MAKGVSPCPEMKHLTVAGTVKSLLRVRANKSYTDQLWNKTQQY